MKKYFLLLLFLKPLLLLAQVTGPVADSVHVRIFADSRIDLLTGKPEKSASYTGKARGFRVQIYSGYDRNKANSLKVNFMRRHPGIRAYLVYNKPHFRVRVGDFFSRSEAAELFQQLSGKYTCMIVPDIINVPPPKSNGN